MCAASWPVTQALVPNRASELLRLSNNGPLLMRQSCTGDVLPRLLKLQLNRQPHRMQTQVQLCCRSKLFQNIPGSEQ